MLPWNNSWFQLGIFAALFSAGLLIYDFAGGVSLPSFSHSSSSATNPPAPTPPPTPTPPPDQSSSPIIDNTLSYPGPESTWENSLNMTFRPAGTHGVLVSIWDTRVSDFQAFVAATGYDATQGVLARDGTGWHETGANWSNPGPGFDQRLDDPVLGVSWNDAVAFSRWLTKKERSEGRIGPHQLYRLPTDAEWTAAAGSGRYPWGNAWPPPVKAGNYLRQDDGVPNNSELRGTDGYAYASPVGTFNPNDYGLYDMGGNVWQWVDDWYQRDMTTEEIRQKVPTLDDDGGGQKYKVARGASFFDSFQLALLTATHDRPAPDSRQMNYGFRCVLVVSP